MRRKLQTLALLAACAAGVPAHTALAQDQLTLDPFAFEMPKGDPAPAAGTSPALASPGVLTLDATAERWTLSFELPIWLSGVEGTAGVRGFTTPLSASFIDILQATSSVVGLGGRFEADYGPWIFYIDGLYMKLAKDNIPVPQSSVNFVAELAIADAGILYQVGNWNLGTGGTAGPSLSLGGVAVRYMHVGMQLNTLGGLSRQMLRDWADPLFATQLKLDIDKHWEIIARGDVGGGGGADLTWSATILFSYRFALSDTVSAAVKLGYQAVAEDYQSGQGAQQFTWDAIMHGPLIDLELRF